MELKVSNPSNNKLINCKYCFSNIHQNAKVCNKCGKYQITFKNNIFSINAFTTIISFFLLVFAFLQYRDSSIAKENSEKAARASQLALKNIIKIEDGISRDKEFISNNTKILSSISEILVQPINWEGRSPKQIDSLKKYFQELKKNDSEFRKDRFYK